MKKHYLLLAFLCFINYSFGQLTVTTAPTSAGATICEGNAISITASATPVSYTMTGIPNNEYDPLSFSTNILVDQIGTYNGIPYVEPLTNGTLDDGRWENIPLPFTFIFYGTSFNSIHITTNGWIGMGSTNTTSTGLGAVIPAAGLPNNVIHAITSDLTFAGAANAAALQYFTVGSAPNRKFVVDYRDLTFFSATGTATVQVILYETTNVVEIHTSICSNTTKTKSQGIENGTGTIGTASTGRNNTANWSATGMPNAYRFTPETINFTWSPAAGLNTTTGPTVIASPAITTLYTVIATGLGGSGNTTVNVTINAASNTLAAVAGGAQVCQNISVSPSGTNYRDGNCNIIAKLIPTGGGTALTNSVNTCVKVETASSTMGTSSLYLARHYDIEPIFNAPTATANIILYYKQTEFDNFNSLAAANNHKLLPTAPADATGISNLILRQFHGTGTTPLNYTGAVADFTTATAGFTVVWNATKSWWEVTIPVNGFSGFYITSQPAGVLPVTLEYFKGVQANNIHLLNWKVNCTSAKVVFEIERSADGQQFNVIGKITADKARCGQPFETADDKPLSGMNYYRIKIIDPDGKFYYSNIISFMNKTKGFNIISLSPNPVIGNHAELKINTGEKTTITIGISDLSGRLISTQPVQLLPGINTVTINAGNLSKGVYRVTAYAANQSPATAQLIKQ